MYLLWNPLCIRYIRRFMSDLTTSTMPKTFETYNAELQNNVLTIQKGNITEAENASYKFFKAGVIIAGGEP